MRPCWKRPTRAPPVSLPFGDEEVWRAGAGAAGTPNRGPHALPLGLWAQSHWPFSKLQTAYSVSGRPPTPNARTRPPRAPPAAVTLAAGALALLLATSELREYANPAIEQNVRRRGGMGRGGGRRSCDAHDRRGRARRAGRHPPPPTPPPRQMDVDAKRGELMRVQFNLTFHHMPCHGARRGSTGPGGGAGGTAGAAGRGRRSLAPFCTLTSHPTRCGSQ